MLSQRIFAALAHNALYGENSVPWLKCVSCRKQLSIGLRAKDDSAKGRHIRHSSSSSSKRWQNRQGRDWFAREARVQGLKSRAAFKLLEVRYIIFTDFPSISQ